MSVEGGVAQRDGGVATGGTGGNALYPGDQWLAGDDRAMEHHVVLTVDAT